MEVLKTDQKADNIFKTLTEGNKRGLIYLVTQVKSIDKRIGRSLKIAERLKLRVKSPREILKQETTKVSAANNNQSQDSV